MKASQVVIAAGMTSLGLRQSIFLSTEVLIIMTTIITLVDRVKVILHQFSPIAITFMALTR